MFKKIEVWIVLLILIINLFITTFLMVLVRQELVGGVKLGALSKAALFIAELPRNMKLMMMDKTEVHNKFPNTDGGFKGTPSKTEQYLLLSRFDKGLDEGIVELIDLKNFQTIHTWNPDISAMNRELEKTGGLKYRLIWKENTALMTAPLLTKDLKLIFLTSGWNSPLRFIDVSSNALFQNYNVQFHHSIEEDLNNNFWIPFNLFPYSNKKLGTKVGDFAENGLCKINSNGEVLFTKSLVDIFTKNNLDHLVYGGPLWYKDPFHLNDIEPVKYKSKYWDEGDVFLSLRHMSLVLLYRPSTDSILWKGEGHTFLQHDIDILDNHRIAIFNNNAKWRMDGRDLDNNQIIIYDFEKDQYSSYLEESMKLENIATPSQGLFQIVKDGGLFIEETDYGRLIYFNSDGTKRWSYINKADNGSVYAVSWSRLIHNQWEIDRVNELIKGTY